MKWFKVLAVLALLLLAMSVGANVTRADGPDKDSLLTRQQMRNAIVASLGKVLYVDGSNLVPGEKKNSAIYRLEDCDTKSGDKDKPCYFVLFVERKPQNGYTIESSQSTLTCGLNYYNSTFGFLMARLQQNVNVTFWNSPNKLPITFNTGDLGGTQTYVVYATWQGLSGPNPNPNWGTRTSNTAYATSSGNLVLNIAGVTSSYYHWTRLTITSTGWSCSGG